MSSLNSSDPFPAIHNSGHSLPPEHKLWDRSSSPWVSSHDRSRYQCVPPWPLPLSSICSIPVPKASRWPWSHNTPTISNLLPCTSPSLPTSQHPVPVPTLLTILCWVENSSSMKTNSNLSSVEMTTDVMNK